MTDTKTFSDDEKSVPRGDAWRFYIDRGGTFTDVVAESPDGVLQSFKLLSQDPRYDDAALEAVRAELGEPAPPGDDAGRGRVPQRSEGTARGETGQLAGAKTSEPGTDDPDSPTDAGTDEIDETPSTNTADNVI